MANSGRSQQTIKHEFFEGSTFILDSRLPKFERDCQACGKSINDLHYYCKEKHLYLHQRCQKLKRKNSRQSQQTIKHEFFEGSTFILDSRLPKFERDCQACGKSINDLHYYCKEKHLYLHQRCQKLKRKFVFGDVDFRLCKKTSSKCFLCKESASKIKGWSYESKCQKYQVHVHCWKTAHGDDIALALKKWKRHLRRRGDGNGERGVKFLEILEEIVEPIPKFLLGDPTGIIDLIFDL